MSNDLFSEDRIEELVDNHSESLGSVLETAFGMRLRDGEELGYLEAIYGRATDDGKAAIDSAILAMLGFTCREILEADRRIREYAPARSVSP